MKRILLFLSICIVAFNSHSQNRSDFFKTTPIINSDTPEWAKLMYSENPNVADVEDLYKQYYKENEFIKNIHTQNHKHWILLVSPLLDENGFIKQLSQSEEDRKHQLLKENYQQQQSLRIPGSDLGWRAMGPFETFATDPAIPISWHKNVYAIDQSLSHPDILICGTEAGGVYKTIDKGFNWSLISLGEVFSGSNSAVKIHPTNPNNFLIYSNNRIYQSLDGGVTWLERHFTNGTGHEFEYSPLNHNIIFHTSSSGLFKSIDGGVTWTQVFTESCWDIDFHPTDNNVAYLLKSNAAAKRSELYRSDDNGITWSIKDNGWYVPSDLANAIDDGGKIAVSPASEDLVYVCLIGASKDGDQGWIGVYKSLNRGENWTNPSGQDGGPYGAINGTADWNVAAYDGGYHQGFYNFDMEASAINPDKLWIATIRLTESNDGGQTFQSIGAANSTRLNYIHADVQDIEVNGNDIWVATDGGIDYSQDELMSHDALNRGIQAAHFWGFNTGWNEDTFTGGKYHDGTSGWYENYGLGNAYNIGGVEEASGYVHPIESRKLLYRTHYASDNTSVKTIPEIFGSEIINHPSLPVRPNESYWEAERSGVYFDPRYADHMYVGLENKVYKSTNGGSSFEIIYTFPESTGLIYEMEISRSNPNVIYAVYNKLGGYWDSCEIWKSVDAGLTWNKTVSDPGGNNRRFRISVHPEDENIVWICTPRGDNGGKVFNTLDGGTTWLNKTTSVLNGQDINDILYQGGTDDIVYLASRYGVFYWDTNANDWINYSTDLPLVTKSLQINPFYRDAELRLGTTGRGVWGRKMLDEAFNPIAQPITYTNLVRCPLESIQFDCYSILNHEDATWQWTITPEPLSISSDTARNPVIVFGAEGAYTVSLTVTDGLGRSDTKTITNMVTVVDDCPHCESFGNMDWDTAVTLVDFNGIYNATGKTQPYTDYTDSHSSTVEVDTSYDLSVNLDTDGDYTIYAMAWIDWNQDTDFEDPGETYDLGSSRNTDDGITSLSPLSITVPLDAEAGETTMRIAAKYNTTPSLCETGFDGEVEDYSIIVTPSLGIIENSFEIDPVIYPNPTDGNFSIELGRHYAATEISITDINGKIIQSNTYYNSQLFNIKLKEASGVYLVIIKSEGQKAVVRLLIK
ncbi:GEVED domain-containing protein [Lacinutrix iliipiscaria]|uniref:GEVED domain-containing protein n=1 Tax=Lacinutrix iliipiscaria TaxID=1230532 RepID=A0ABW5WKZ0_9FLAO